MTDQNPAANRQHPTDHVSSPLTIFYTYGINGDLDYLPQLYTYLQYLKRTYDRHALLLDIGQSCAADVWHCDVTGGRSTLVVLDGMGYHAANVTGFLAAGQRDQLKTVISTGMVDEQHAWRYHVPPVRDEGVIVAAQPVPALTMCIVAAPAEKTHIVREEAGVTLYLGKIRKDQIGWVTINLYAMVAFNNMAFDVPADTKPDPTITAAVGFVKDEARAAQKRRGG